MVHDFIEFAYRDIQAERLFLMNVSPLTSRSVTCGRVKVLIENNTALLNHRIYVKS